MILATLKHEEITPWQSATVVYARVHENKWIADCDEWPCTGAEFVTEGQEMICGSCGAVSDVVWPDEVSEIELLLNRRRNPANRNWNPGETLAGLRLENDQHREELV